MSVSQMQLLESPAVSDLASPMACTWMSLGGFACF